MKIIITMDIDPEYSDPGHKTGVTEQGYDLISAALEPVGTDIDVSAADELRP